MRALTNMINRWENTEPEFDELETQIERFVTRNSNAFLKRILFHLPNGSNAAIEAERIADDIYNNCDYEGYTDKYHVSEMEALCYLHDKNDKYEKQVREMYLEWKSE